MRRSSLSPAVSKIVPSQLDRQMGGDPVTLSAPLALTMNPTTCFLTATALVCAIGAGITVMRLLAPDLPSKWSSTRSRNWSRFSPWNVRGQSFLVNTSLSQDWVICAVRSGRFARLLCSSDVVAIFQTSSP